MLQQTSIIQQQTSSIQHYDYIFSGSGLSAFLTVYEMMQCGKFADKSILLIDADLKKDNDRTWCFWEKDSSDFESIIHKKWTTAIFANNHFKHDLDFADYEYKMIRGADFYQFVFNEINKNPNIQFVQQSVLSYEDLNDKVEVKTNLETYTCDKLFNSILTFNWFENDKKFPLLKQHFIGWFIKSDQAVFTPEKATFMDFSVPQENHTQFMYVLPTSTTEALLEPTYFSANLEDKTVYENKIKTYATNLGITNFEIIEKELGNIPMTCYEFWKNNTKNIVNIGSAGGWTKASTGFTFKHSTKKAKKLVQFLQTENNFKNFHKKTKFWYYDLLFIDVLHKNNALGSSVFSGLFKKGKANLVFKFLDEETSFLEDLQVMLRCPTLPFVKALLGRLF
jgi:lycopene beta-cyclase